MPFLGARHGFTERLPAAHTAVASYHDSEATRGVVPRERKIWSALHMKPILFIAGALVLASSCLLLPDAYAQFGGGGRHGGDRSKGCDSGADKTADKSGNPGNSGAAALSADQLSYQLSTLEVDLKLSPEQAGVWGQFAEQVRALQTDQQRERSRGISANASAPSAFNSMQAIRTSVDRARNRMTALEDLEMSAKAAYASLQPDQKAQADLRLGAFLQTLIRG